MFERFPIQKKHLLVVGTLLMLLLCYQLSFKKTIAAWQMNKQLNAQFAQSINLSIQPAYLERKNLNLHKIINSYRIDTNAFRSNILSTISLMAEKENVKLSEIPIQDPLYNNQRFIYQKLSFEGNFFDLTKVLDELKKGKGIGMIRSIAYKAINLHENSGQKLLLEIWVETVK